MNCPKCGGETTYVGGTKVDCVTVGCANWGGKISISNEAKEAHGELSECAGVLTDALVSQAAAYANAEPGSWARMQAATKAGIGPCDPESPCWTHWIDRDTNTHCGFSKTEGGFWFSGVIPKDKALLFGGERHGEMVDDPGTHIPEMWVDVKDHVYMRHVVDWPIRDDVVLMAHSTPGAVIPTFSKRGCKHCDVVRIGNRFEGTECDCRKVEETCVLCAAPGWGPSCLCVKHSNEWCEGPIVEHEDFIESKLGPKWVRELDMNIDGATGDIFAKEPHGTDKCWALNSRVVFPCSDESFEEMVVIMREARRRRARGEL